ncbi:1300_t:CDS:2 [Funneliformis geosporum]|uniref:1300_t:CDS:1 n=1 Tax=Funneliformis geosporum TaxID=1117311 RepID=A0A9W4SAA7_9GLOM|nr:1300_t:CDS:2 [Funneliformis geosporum]
MTQKGKEDEGSDILSDSLLNPQNIGKEFELFQFNTENADLFYSENAKDYVGPSDEEIDNADENQCKKYIEELKQAYGKGEKPGKMDKTHSELQNLVDLINSTGTYYEIHSEIGYTAPKYNEVKAKVEGGDPNFSKYLIQFKTESERSENGVSANQALPTLTLGEKIEDKYFYLFKNTALTDDERIQKLNEKKAKKQAFNNTKDVRKKIENILERKDKVINLIEDLVAGRGPDTPDISQVRDRAKSDIQTELNTAPKTENSELGQNADWENKLNGLDKENEINNFKNKLITEIKNIRTRKESGSKLDKLLAEAKSKENYEELEPVMKNIAKFSRTTAYKNKKTEIEAQQRRLQDYDPTGKKYAKTVHTIIGEALSEVSLNEQDLGDKIKKDLKDLKDNNISDKQKIKGIEEAALKKIGETNANKKFKLIKDKADKAISSNDKTKIDEAKTEINNFLAIDDIYFQAKNTEAQQLLKCLNIPNQHNNGGDKDNSSNFP